MKINGVPGIYYAQAFIASPNEPGIKLCGCYHKARETAFATHTGLFREWPVEIMDGIAYVPSEEELRDAC